MERIIIKNITLGIRTNEDAHESQIRKNIREDDRILELGCGDTGIIYRLGQNKVRVGVDLCFNELASSRNKGVKLVLSDIRYVNRIFKKKSFDVVILSDILEHLDKDDGIIFINHCIEISSYKILLFIPEGFVRLLELKNEYCQHLSGWTAEELENIGFKQIIRWIDYHRDQDYMSPRTCNALFGVLEI